MPRFWVPILPIMLVLIVDLVPARACVPLFALLLTLNVSELYVHLGNYQRRINNVSDALADAAATIVKHSPALIAVAGSSEHFVFAWYLSQTPGGGNCEIRSPQSESFENFLVRITEKNPQKNTAQLFIISYFSEPLYPQRPIFQRERITAVWRISPENPPPILQKPSP